MRQNFPGWNPVEAVSDHIQTVGRSSQKGEDGYQVDPVRHLSSDEDAAFEHHSHTANC